MLAGRSFVDAATTCTIHGMQHGTPQRYRARYCRCPECRQAWAEYFQERRGPQVDRVLLGELLRELFPHGLTEDAPLAKLREPVSAATESASPQA